MNTNMMDEDPLSSYQHYNAYQSLPYPPSIPIVNGSQPNMHLQPTIPHTQPNIPNIEPTIPYPYYNKGYYPYQNIPSAVGLVANQNSQGQTDRELNKESLNTQDSNIQEPVTTNNDTSTNIPDPPKVDEEEDIKPDISKIKLKRTYKLKGKTSSYWNKKITDKDFKFYGCSVCNISFGMLPELDNHVLIHTNRITSYDVRIQNLKKRKRLKKEKHKKKRNSKVKVEPEIEIKPEDGYIGTEKATDINQTVQKVEKIDAVDANKKEKLNQNGLKKDQVYKCFACNKKFALSYYLKIHVRSHTDEKPYTCSKCGQTFITASKLGRHTKRIHLAVRHQCRICFSFFSRFELLTKHFDKKHADQKLEGEPYDYNAILPYLTELEEQFKMEAEAKKPKTEDLWGDWPSEVPREAPEASEALEAPKLEETKVEKEEKEIPQTFEFSDSTPKDEKMEDVEIKHELEEPEVLVDQAFPEFQCIDETFEPDPSSDDEDVKEERYQVPLTDDEEEYFPPDGWARSPPPDSPPPPSPPVRRKGGAGVCELCNRSFSTRSYLKVHMRTHTGEKPYSCYVCGRGFITASKMHRHVLTHDETWVGEDRIKPEGADIKSETETDDVKTEKKHKGSQSKIAKSKAKLLKKPKKEVKPKVKKYRGRPHCCEFCGSKFLHIETLQVHKKSHEGEELLYKCTYCLEPQLDQESKLEHEASHVGPKPYLCTLCGRQYKERSPMLYHRKNHNADDEKQFICDICSKRFNSQAKLARHIVTHSTEKFVLRYECPVCANMFHTRWHVQMHLKSHQKEGLILEENRNAVLAMVLQNARKIPKSSNTSNTSTDPQTQSVALELHPPDERSRICNICGQVFQHFYYLEEHLKTHGTRIAVEDLDKEEEKKYTCQVCSKSFKLHYYLKLHSFTHTKEKPFICQQCGKGFITKGKLKRHLETHQGLKKYQCHVCCKFFTRPSYLRIHVRTIHGTQDYNFRDYGVGVPVGLGLGPLGQIGI